MIARRIVRWLLTAAVLFVLFHRAPTPVVIVLVGGTSMLVLLGVLFVRAATRRAAVRRSRPLRRPS